MRQVLFYPSYFPNILSWIHLINFEIVIFNTNTYYQKQTFRNRLYLSGPNGKILLTIPIKHSRGNQKQKYRDIKMDEPKRWLNNHWKTITTAYRSAPYFEYFEDVFNAFYHQEYQYLVDLNVASVKLILSILNLDTEIRLNNEDADVPNFYFMIDAKSNIDYHFRPYSQVFSTHYNFIPNLSVLDLVFNLGYNDSILYLRDENHKMINFA